MIHILKQEIDNDIIFYNVDNDVDLNRALNAGAIELSEKEIEEAGIKGYEKYVSSDNTKIDNNGKIVFIPPAISNFERDIYLFSVFTQKALDDFAKTKQYDSMLQACSYYNSTNQQYAKEANYCIKLRDNTWEIFYEITNAYNELSALPSIQDFLRLLPVFNAKWPT